MNQKSEKNECLPLWWYLFLACVLAVGIAFLACHCTLPPLVARLSSRVKPDGWCSLLGIMLLSIVLSHIVVSLSLRFTWRLFDLEGPIRRINLWPPALVGLLESVLYPVALLTKHTDFIGLWMLLKVAGQWPRWGLEAKGQNEERVKKLDEGRRRYSNFLIGNALNLLVALVAYGFLKMFVLI